MIFWVRQHFLAERRAHTVHDGPNPVRSMRPPRDVMRARSSLMRLESRTGWFKMRSGWRKRMSNEHGPLARRKTKSTGRCSVN